ncbi:hypothetical protein B5X24_HaOG207422 [Helicoverpa armigera]|nr:hypothetical protein B5X24_HaOG207422 [Helicoverpa armigera]
MKPVTNFKEWKFRDPPNYAALPIDENPEYNVPMAVIDSVFSKVPTEPLTGKLHLVCASDPALIDLLDLDPSVADTEEFINFVAGAYLPEGGLTVSHRYGVSDDHKVWRDKTYSGRSRQERAATVMRLANAWYRIGSLEILLKRKEPHTLKLLADFIIENHFPEIASSGEDKYVKWYSEVAHKNLDMVATWQGLGFVHGVLNTDNVSLLGLTIDYGPYGFIDHYYEHYVPNTSDDMGRYAYNKQPEILVWNLGKLAEAMEPILSDAQKQEIKDIHATLDDYVKTKVLKTYLLKLGLKQIQDGDHKLVEDLFTVMQLKMADFTATFRQLAEVEPHQLLEKSVLETKWSLNKFSGEPTWEKWVQAYQDRLKKENVSEDERRERMVRVNPVYVPRNWILEEAIKDAENNNFEKVRFLLKLFENPFEINEEAEKRGYSAQPPSWSYGLKLSCSS